jgi:hypothetical protein
MPEYKYAKKKEQFHRNQRKITGFPGISRRWQLHKNPESVQFRVAVNASGSFLPGQQFFEFTLRFRVLVFPELRLFARLATAVFGGETKAVHGRGEDAPSSKHHTLVAVLHPHVATFHGAAGCPAARQRAENKNEQRCGRQTIHLGEDGWF